MATTWVNTKIGFDQGDTEVKMRGIKTEPYLWEWYIAK